MPIGINLLVTFPLERLRKKTPFPRLMLLPQYKTEAILLKRLKCYGTAEVKFGVEATSIGEKENSVTVGYASKDRTGFFSGRYLIGCDGANSFVREELGIKLSGQTFPFKAALADIRIDRSTHFESPRISGRKKVQISFRIDKDLWRVIFIRGGGEEAPISGQLKESINSLFGKIAYREIWNSEFSLHSRTAEAFARGHIVLAGDAAHINSPVGGQGMNAGIIDIRNLAPALIKALKDPASQALGAYAEKRKEAIKKGVNRNTRWITRLVLYKRGKYAKTVFRILKYLLKIPFIRSRFLRNMAMVE